MTVQPSAFSRRANFLQRVPPLDVGALSPPVTPAVPHYHQRTCETPEEKRRGPHAFLKGISTPFRKSPPLDRELQVLEVEHQLVTPPGTQPQRHRNAVPQEAVTRLGGHRRWTTSRTLSQAPRPVGMEKETSRPSATLQGVFGLPSAGRYDPHHISDAPRFSDFSSKGSSSTEVSGGVVVDGCDPRRLSVGSTSKARRRSSSLHPAGIRPPMNSEVSSARRINRRRSSLAIAGSSTSRETTARDNEGVMWMKFLSQKTENDLLDYI